MQGDDRGGFLFRKVARDGALALLERGKARADLRERAGTIGDGIDEARDLLFDLRQLAPLDATGAPIGHRVRFARAMKLGDEQADGGLAQQLLLQPREHAPLDLGDRDREAVRTQAALAMRGASDPAGAVDRIGRAALSAADQARQEMLRAAAMRDLQCSAAIEPRLDAGPEFIVDDAQRRHRDNFQLAVGIGPRDAVAGLWIAQHADAVVDQLADIDRVVQHTEPPGAIAGDAGDAPFAAAHRGHALAIEVGTDARGAAPGGVFAADPAHDRRLFLVDLAQAANGLALVVEIADDAVTVTQAAGHAAARHRPALAAPDLLGHLLQLERVHRALEADMQLAHLARGERVNARAGKGDALEDRGDILLIAREAVLVLDEEPIGAAAGDKSERGLQSRPPRVRAGNCTIGEGVDDRPALRRGEAAAVCDLVVGGAVGLPVGREAGIDGAAHGALPDSRWPAASSAARRRANARTIPARGSERPAPGISRPLPAAPRRARR